MNTDLLVVGGGIAALRTVETAREEGFTGSITLVTDEPHPPYDRPPLSKLALKGDYDRRVVEVREQSTYPDIGVELIIDNAATTLDLGNKTVSCADGTIVHFNQLIIATGTRARTLQMTTPKGVHTIRTQHDSAVIAQALRTQPRVAVIGGGFIGAEVASTARELGCEVTIVEAAPIPLTRVLGNHVGQLCSNLHQANGVRVLTTQTLRGFMGKTHVTGVLTEDHEIPAELVVIGIGALPNTEWLEDSGLEISNGILCDEQGQCLSAPTGDVYAVGDIASWFNPRTLKHERYEHWTSAVEQAQAVGKQLAGTFNGDEQPVPYFWSDQHGKKIQMLGTPGTNDDFHFITGTTGAFTFVGAYIRKGDITALLSIGAPRDFAKLRRKVPIGSHRDVLANIPS